MAFLASKGVLAEVLAKASARAIHTKSLAQSWRTTLATGPVTSGFVIAIDGEVLRIRTEMQGYGATTGIAAFAQANTPDAPVDYDVVAEWNAMLGAIDNVSAWIRTNFPVDANGYLLARTWAADRQFTAAQTAGLRTQLDALIATVE